MSKVKIIIVFFLTLAGFLFIGESYTFFLENFQDSYVQVGYYLETGDSEEEMKKAILEGAKEYDSEVFAIVKEDGGAFSRKIIIYGNDKVRQNLKRDWNIEEGVTSSFFSGKTRFEFKNFNQATEKELSNCWYMNTSPEDLYTMLFPGMVSYSGNFRNDPMLGISEKVIAGLWFLLIITILLLSYYDTLYNKKEQMIRIVLGADSKSIMLDKFIKDTLGFSLAALASISILLPFTNPLFRWRISLISFMILIVSNLFVIMYGMKTGKYAQIKSNKSNDKLFVVSMFIRAIVAILTILVLSATIYLSRQGINLYRQKDYYSNLKNKVHVDIDYPYDYDKMEYAEGYYEGKRPINTSEQVIDNFMRYSYKELDFSLMTYQPQPFIAPKWGDKHVFSNLKGLQPYSDQILEWDKLIEKESNYILISDAADGTEILKEIMKGGNSYGLNGDEKVEVIKYKEGLSVTAEGVIEDELDYSYRIKNPIIFLDTFDYGSWPLYTPTHKLKEQDYIGGLIANGFEYLMKFVTLDNNQEKIYGFANEISGEAINLALVEFSVINVGDWFNGLWSLQNRSLLIALILTVLIIILYLQISSLTLRMAYETKAEELTVKKVIGYSVFERFKPFFLIIISLCGISLIGSILFSIIFKMDIISYLIWGSLIVLALDISILMYWINKNDNIQIQKILKGGI